MPRTSWSFPAASAGPNTSSILEGSVVVVADPAALLAALEDGAERDDDDEPRHDRHDALPHRAARRVHEVDRLGLLGHDLAGTGVARAGGRETGVGRLPVP